MRAVDRIVSEPPNSTLRAAPRNFRGGCRAEVGDAAGQDAAGGRGDDVVGAGEPGDRVEQDDDITSQLDEALGALDGQLGHHDVVLGAVVERGVHDLAGHRPADVGDLFGPLADQHHHQVRLGVARADRGGDLLEHQGLAGLGRRDDEAALAETDGADQVDDPGGGRGGASFQADPLVRVQRGQRVERGTAGRLGGRQAGHGVNPGQSGVGVAVPGLAVAGRGVTGLAVAGRGRRSGLAGGTGDLVAAPQCVLLDQRGRHEHIVRADPEAGGTEEGAAVTADVENAGDGAEHAGLGGLCALLSRRRGDHRR